MRKIKNFTDLLKMGGKMRRGFYIIIFLMLLVCLLKGEDITKEEFIIKGWENSLNKIKNAKCRYIVEGERKLILPEKEEIKKMKLYECEWKYKYGKEVLKGIYFDEKGERRLINEFYFDGQTTSIISTIKEEKNGSICNGKDPNIFVLLPPSMVLFYFYPGISFQDLITSSYIKTIGEERLNNDFCYKMSIIKEINGGKINFLFWISKDKDFLPIKIVLIRQNSSQVLEVYYNKIEDIWFPYKIVGYNEDIKGKKKGYTVGFYEEIRLNIEMKDEEFKVKFPPGISVFDSRLGISFETPK